MTQGIESMKILDVDDDIYLIENKRSYSKYSEWWKKPSIVAALCLGVLLLAVVIGLMVNFNNQHYSTKTLLQNSYKNLTKEQERIKANFEWLKSKVQVNLALNGLVAQSSHGSENAHKAVDGDRSSNYFFGSCTHTDKDTNPWWRVDLRDVYRVRRVSLTNRGDCCPERLNGAEIRIGNSLENNGTKNPRCAYVQIPAGETRFFQCNEMEGRYVVVVIPGRAEWLTLCEVEVYGSPAVNLALNGVAVQSSLYGNNKASDAIDGLKKTHHEACTQTQKETNPWWRVDLKDEYRNIAVSLTNRGDCCPERLDGAEIHIGNSLENNGINNPRCAVISHIPAGESQSFQCDEMEGRYVVVVIPGRKEVLTLCEVEIYGSPAVNLALDGVAAQSSLFGNRNATDAIAGNSDDNSGSCTHTQKDTNPWWRVDLRDVYRIRSVSLTNRGDCCPERLDGAEIRIGNSLENNGINNPRCAVISHIPAGESQFFQCNEMEGRYVVVVIPGRKEVLTLCEVKVYGSLTVNLALNGVAAQSSLYANTKASDAIDGDRKSNYHAGSCTHTHKDYKPWWRVDLRDVYRIRTVSLTNRGDCCPERLDGAEIRIGNSLELNGIMNPRCAVISHVPAGVSQSFQCDEMEGRYVVVVIPGRAEWLTLCEVEVRGLPAVNLALNGVAAQSSLYGNRKASDAIDGDKSADHKSCTHTQNDTDPWWRVDLRHVYKVRTVSLTNRGDCCPERLDGAEIRIGNSLENNGINNPRCAVISHIPAGESQSFQCDKMEGRYVVVVIPGRKEVLTLCEVEVYGSPAVNLALNGVAAQSSVFGNHNASDAIDGNKDSHYHAGSCTHTQKDTNPWWRVDLRDVYRVRTVSLTNRGDCCPERLDGAEIRIGNSLENNGINNPRCAVISHVPAGETHYFQCDEMEGRYVVVVIPGRAEWLTLCEVDVYGSPPVNLALNGVAAQSSLVWNTQASDAIDGDKDSHFHSGSCTHTQKQSKPWWRVDLRDVYRVRTVSLTNRGDCCPERLDGAEIRIGNSLEINGIQNPRCAVISHIPAGESQSFQCNEMEGRYVVVVIPGRKEWLTLCEVEVYGSPADNLALNGVAAQSSLYGNRNPSDAIDGNKDSHYNSGSCTHTQMDTNPWWRVDLRHVYKVRTVSLTNRGDCCAERLDGAEIRIGNSLENNGINNTRCAVISHIAAGESQSFQCNEMEGRYVVVVIPGMEKWLTLCEVEVFGSPAVNLALNGVAAQSSLFGNRNASDAIDGDKNAHYSAGSCTHTQNDNNPWWRVDLRHVYRVRTVSLTNRGDCCPERLDGAEIRIGNSLENNGINNPRCAVISHVPAGETHYFQCDEMEGRYVVVVIPGRAEWLTLCEVEVYGSPPVNMALNGVAVQSSRYGSSKASDAIDGDKDSHYHSGSCTHTQNDYNPWWRVDLKNLYRIRAVSLTNRGDCCPERLDGAEIRIGNSLENNGINNPRCAVISHIPAGESQFFQCDEMEGHYVVVVIPGRTEWLTLCEVEVYGTIVVNLALNGVAAQSSLYANTKASDAIDGNKNSYYHAGSCTHTQNDNNPWWRVDLRHVYKVRTVSLTNRGDCCAERLDGAEIRIGNSLENNGINNTRCAVISHVPAGETHYFQCDEMEGRYVVVVIPGRAEWLTLCEVDVYGSPAVNLALNGVAAQSSLYANTKASDAIDGNKNSHHSAGSCTHTQNDTDPWWRVDLRHVYRVRTVSLTNRGDCCAERLDGAEIRIGNSLELNGINNTRCAVISHVPAGETHYFQCDEMEGRYVVVVIPGRAEWLTLCEVDVYGSPAVNLALNGLSAQSSLFGNKNASDAIDGNKNSHYNSGSCTHTQNDTDPWWRVDLRHVYKVRTVSLTNRGDCCAERLDGAEIRIGNSLELNGTNNTRCAVISHVPAGETHYFQCNEMEGRYVVVVIPGRKEVLTLCEVEVYGSQAGSLS
ncbi:hypothetical protein UPYG_G00163900 [Umbra pygmaea]|uniref:Fucolectin tachylectin-4 pentraxin-1 domain-containing protein n=1 Tax=Umbra pygmaea TaxID=75934 RepID=A0ABD0WNR3_UMBPY